MAVEQSPDKLETNSSLVIAVVIVLVAVAILAGVFSLVFPQLLNFFAGIAYQSGGPLYDSIFVILTITTDLLYLLGGGVIAFGALLVILRFVHRKIGHPFQPTLSTHYLSGYLTLSLNFFIGAEIVRTVIIRSSSEFELLILVILSRGLFSLILYLDRRWFGTAESE